ncbi:MAG: hypothetical protein KBF80_11030, partial [Flavobacteriales bacterium]|nr:hypothetical protein [Flavobacteriales bacterium]
MNAQFQLAFLLGVRFAHRPQATGHRPQATGHRPQATGSFTVQQGTAIRRAQRAAAFVFSTNSYPLHDGSHTTMA